MQGEGVGKPPSPPLDNPFKPFYDAVIDPILDMLEPQDDELVIVPDGALCFTPWSAVIESIRIRTVPSLTSYQLILSVPEGHHKKKGALLVGNPCLKELKKPLDDLPCAQKEVEMIASILKITPLTGIHATKAEVMKRMSSVGLIHIAAHGNERTGEIALSPNPGWSSKFPQRKDYILKMSDVQAANLRARLVVLSCCHSGRGRVLKGEGVVGIARAFLAAGARSVLVTLWAIDDEATISTEIGDRGGEGRAYGSLGNAYQSLGDYRKAIEYHEKHLKIAIEIGDRGGEGRGYGSLGNAYQSLGDYRKAIEYHEKLLKIAKEIGDRGGEGGAYGNLGNAYQSLGDYPKAIEHHEKHLKIAIEIGDRKGEGGAYGSLGSAYGSLFDYRKAIEYHEKFLKIAKEIGDQAGEGAAYHNALAFTSPVLKKLKTQWIIFFPLWMSLIL